jgi:hypothetical protein
VLKSSCGVEKSKASFLRSYTDRPKKMEHVSFSKDKKGKAG